MRRTVVLFAVMLLLISCIGPQGKGVTTDPAQMSPEQKVVFAWGIYKAQYHDYQALTAEPEKLTEEQREILRKKKAALVVAYNSIMAYRMVVNAGETPTPEQEQAVMSFINQFAY